MFGKCFFSEERGFFLGKCKKFFLWVWKVGVFLHCARWFFFQMGMKSFFCLNNWFFWGNYEKFCLWFEEIFGWEFLCLSFPGQSDIDYFLLAPFLHLMNISQLLLVFCNSVITYDGVIQANFHSAKCYWVSWSLAEIQKFWNMY